MEKGEKYLNNKKKKIFIPQMYKTELVFRLEEAISRFKLFSGKYFANLGLGITAELLMYVSACGLIFEYGFKAKID